MKKTCTLLFVALFCSAALSAQNKPLANSLLWRISGNGLKQPSYLYGTMHVNDPRVFELGDSLYAAIERCEGFALESSPENMNSAFGAKIWEELRSDKPIKLILTPEAFKKYGPPLSKLLNKEAGTITIKDLKNAQRNPSGPAYFDQFTSTSLSIYLCNIARHQDKWVGGLEDYNETVKILNREIDSIFIKELLAASPSNGQAAQRSFTEAYFKQDLNNLSVSSYFTSSFQINKRSLKMAGSIDSISHIRSTVYAINWAFLPGEKGLIKLLQAKGYSVTPVFYSKIITPDALTINPIETTWIENNSDNGLFKLKAPGKMQPIVLPGSVESKAYLDFYTGILYRIEVVNFNSAAKNRDSLLASIWTSRLKGDIVSIKNLSNQGLNGKLTTISYDGEFKTSFFLAAGDLIWEVSATFQQQDEHSEKEIQHYLKEFKVILPRKTNSPASYYTVTDSTYCFTVNLPTMPRKEKNKLPELAPQMNSVLYTTSNLKTGEFFTIAASELNPGYFIENDRQQLDLMRQSFIEKCSKITLDSLYFLDGHYALDMSGITKKSKVRAHYELRGSRTYSIIVTSDKTILSDQAKFCFESFKLLPYKDVPWSTHTIEGQGISVWAPSLPVKKVLHEDEDLYLSYDPIRANSFEISIINFPKNFWQDGESNFWKFIAHNFLDAAGDSIVSTQSVRNGTVEGKEFLIKQPNSTVTQIRRALQAGNRLYTLKCYIPDPDIKNENISRFFNEFRLLATPEPTTLFTSKTALILQDLDSSDSLTFLGAVKALQSTPFITADLPLWHQALLKNYPNSTIFYYSPAGIISRKLIELADSGTLQFATDNYLRATDNKQRQSLLNIIASYKTPENYRNLAQLLLQSPPTTEFDYQFIEDVKASGPAASELFPGILQLIKYQQLAGDVIDLTTNLIDSSRCEAALVEPFYTDIMVYANSLFDSLRNDPEMYGLHEFTTVEMLGHMSNKASTELLQKWLSLGSSHNYSRLQAIAQLLHKKEKVDKKVIQELAANPNLRIVTYETLRSKDQEILFPKKYRNQLSLAEGLLYDEAAEEEFEPEKVEFLKSGVHLFQGKSGLYYYFKVRVDEEDYLAGVGPFDPDTKNLDYDNAIGSFYYEAPFDAANLDEQIEAFFKYLEQWAH